MQAFRHDLGHGKHVVVVGDDPVEAADIAAAKHDQVQTNRRKHGYWDPKFHANEIPRADWDRQEDITTHSGVITDERFNEQPHDG